jgi:hypothetical protein
LAGVRVRPGIYDRDGDETVPWRGAVDAVAVVATTASPATTAAVVAATTAATTAAVVAVVNRLIGRARDAALAGVRVRPGVVWVARR